MARTATIIPQEVKEQMCRDYRRGLSVKEIGAIYQIGISRTREIVRNSCEKKAGRPSNKNHLVYESMLQDYLNGLSIKKIAKKYNGTLAWVYKILKKEGYGVRENAPRKSNDIINDLKLGEMTQSEIARKYNVSRQYILKVKKKMEVNEK